MGSAFAGTNGLVWIDSDGERHRIHDEKESREEAMKCACMLMLAAGTALATGPVLAADVTSERLLNTDKEPQNWLMNHRTYDGQRYSPLDRITKSNVKGLKLAYAVPLGGGAG